MADIYIDWRVCDPTNPLSSESYSHNIQAQWVAILKGVTESYKNEIVPAYYDLVAQYYSDVDGPYLLGDKITYADFAVYQSIDNDTRTGTIPVSVIYIHLNYSSYSPHF